MSTISKTETPTGQEETAILLEEYARRIATLQESLKPAGRANQSEAVILQEIKRVVDERDDLKRRLENAELLIERLKAREIKLKQFESSERCANKLWREAHQGKDFWPGKTGLLVWLMDEVGESTPFIGWLRSVWREENNLKRVTPSFETLRHWVISLIDNATAKQPEVITKPSKALQNIDVVKRVLVENSCPSEFGLEDCEFNPESGCTLCCEDCWNEEVEE